MLCEVEADIFCLTFLLPSIIHFSLKVWVNVQERPYIGHGHYKGPSALDLLIFIWVSFEWEFSLFSEIKDYITILMYSIEVTLVLVIWVSIKFKHCGDNFAWKEHVFDCIFYHELSWKESFIKMCCYFICITSILSVRLPARILFRIVILLI